MTAVTSGAWPRVRTHHRAPEPPHDVFPRRVALVGAVAVVAVTSSGCNGTNVRGWLPDRPAVVLQITTPTERAHA